MKLAGWLLLLLLPRTNTPMKNFFILSLEFFFRLLLYYTDAVAILYTHINIVFIREAFVVYHSYYRIKIHKCGRVQNSTINEMINWVLVANKIGSFNRYVYFGITKIEKVSLKTHLSTHKTEFLTVLFWTQPHELTKSIRTKFTVNAISVGISAISTIFSENIQKQQSEKLL